MATKNEIEDFLNGFEVSWVNKKKRMKYLFYYRENLLHSYLNNITTIFIFHNKKKIQFIFLKSIVIQINNENFKIFLFLFG